MNILSKNLKSALTGTTLLFLVGSVNPALASSVETNRYVVAQSRVLEAISAESKILYLNNDRTYSYNLVATRPGIIGNIQVPAGATIVGRYVPTEGGLQYVAQAIVYDRYSYRISAISQRLEDVKDPRDTSVGAIATDAGIGAAGGAALGEILGDDAKIGAGVGAALGTAIGNISADRVVVIDPRMPITLYGN